MKIIGILVFLASSIISASQYSGKARSFIGIESGVSISYGKIKDANSIQQYKQYRLNYGFIGGMQYFPNRYFGGRLYASANFIHSVGEHTIIFGGNLDGIVNFVSVDNGSFGIFAGIFLGADTYFGSGVNDAKTLLYQYGLDMKSMVFDAAINVGLRGVISDKFILEIATRVPLVESNLIDTSAYNANSVAFSIKHYTINARFSYLF